MALHCRPDQIMLAYFYKSCWEQAQSISSHLTSIYFVISIYGADLGVSNINCKERVKFGVKMLSGPEALVLVLFLFLFPILVLALTLVLILVLVFGPDSPFLKAENLSLHSCSDTTL